MSASLNQYLVCNTHEVDRRRLRLARRSRACKRREERVARPRQCDEGKLPTVGNLRLAAADALLAYRALLGGSFWNERDRQAFARLEQALR